MSIQTNENQLTSEAFKKQKWKMLLLTMSCYLFFYTGRHNFGWAANKLAITLEISYQKIGWISFAMLLGYGVGQVINGNLADRVSPKHMVTIGGLLSVLMNVLISFSSSFALIAIFWTLNGYFQSMAWASGGRIISNWWRDKHRGLAFGMYTMAAGSSSVIVYVMSILLINEDWRSLFRIPVLFLLIACVVFFFLVKNKPADIGFGEEVAGSQKPPDWSTSYSIILANKRFLIVCLSIGFQSMARYGLIFWIPLYFISKQAGGAASQVWISLLLPAGMAIGAISFGFISDKIFNSNRIISIAFGMGMCCAISLAIYCFEIQSPLLTGTLVFFAGFFSYGPQANFWPLSPELLGQQFVGTGIGIMNMCAYFFAALGEPLMGRLIDTTGNKSIIFITVAIISLLSAITILLVRRFENNYTQHVTTEIE